MSWASYGDKAELIRSELEGNREQPVRGLGVAFFTLYLSLCVTIIVITIIV